jgi:TatD DNase family protein
MPHPLPLIDSHAHLTKAEGINQVHAVLERAKLAGLQKIVNICTDIETLKEGVALRQHYPWIYNTASTTPHDVDKEGDSVFPIVKEYAKQGHLVAIGETGLDYYYSHSSPENQKKFLRKYLHLALEFNLPVVIHCREAFQDFFEILDQEYVVNNKHAPGVLHCFTGTVKEAEEVIKRGWYLSLSGIVTFKKSQELRDVAKMAPLNQLLVETDSPYLAPNSKRGKQNEPAFIYETAEIIANLKGIDLEVLSKATIENTNNLFKLL